MRRVPPFWQNHTMDPPIPWEDWNDMFKLALIAKENIDINNLIYFSDPKTATQAIFQEAPDPRHKTRPREGNKTSQITRIKNVDTKTKKMRQP